MVEGGETAGKDGGGGLSAQDLSTPPERVAKPGYEIGRAGRKPGSGQGRAASGELISDIRDQKRALLLEQKNKLRELARRLSDDGLGGSEREVCRRDVRRTLEVLSLMYASGSANGADFRSNVALAVELSGWKDEARVRAKEGAKRREAKKEATSELVRRTKLVEAERTAVREQEF